MNTALCIELEHYETDPWAPKSVLKIERLSPVVLDPCCGTGIMSEAAKDEGYQVHALDIFDWGYPDTIKQNFLTLDPALVDLGEDFTVFMNPPFSKAVEFVEKSIELGARKIVSFQRFSWWESKERKDFWLKHPPSIVYICGDRAKCWRHDLPKDEKGNRYDHSGKRLSSSPTAHAFFVWDASSRGETRLSHIWRSHG